ncbi:MAG: DinB family protein [Anaerolineaceae bacterium]
MFTEALSGLPDEALVWRPDVQNANSLAVLAAHSISATRFWLANGAGAGKTIEEYRRVDRGPSFAVAGGAPDDFRAQFDALLSDLATLFESGNEAHLAAEVAQPADPSMTRTGVECLIHGIGHLREHVGQAQLMRDLWLGRRS